jgi:hypothetical protein
LIDELSFVAPLLGLYKSATSIQFESLNSQQTLSDSSSLTEKRLLNSHSVASRVSRDRLLNLVLNCVAAAAAAAVAVQLLSGWGGGGGRVMVHERAAQRARDVVLERRFQSAIKSEVVR